jgi:hypothetical protein
VPNVKKYLVESIVYQATVSTNDNRTPQTYTLVLLKTLLKLDITTTKRHLICTRKGTPQNLVKMSVTKSAEELNFPLKQK